MNRRMKNLKLNFNSSIETVPLIGKTVKGACSFETKDEEVLYQLELSVVEILNNIIKHAYGNENDHEIEIEICLDENACSIYIKDTGKPNLTPYPKDIKIDKDKIMDIPESGMGLFIVYHLMDEVSYHSENSKNITHLKKFFHPTKVATSFS